MEKPNNSRFVDLREQRFGRLTVTGYAGKMYDRAGAWYCRCDCGGEIKAISYNLRRGRVKSCGCLVREMAVARIKAMPDKFIASRRRHGLTNSPTWKTWAAMLTRCTNPNRSVFKHYGGRGITVCDRWKIFENFWADMGDRPAGKTLDRIDVNGNYEPDNCKWSTHKEQCQNRRPRGHHQTA